MENNFNKELFLLRTQLAELHCQVAMKRLHGSGHASSDFNNTMSAISEKVSILEEGYASDEVTFNRRELLVLEPKCWKSQAIMLANEEKLTLKSNTRAVVEARSIVR